MKTSILVTEATSSLAAELHVGCTHYTLAIICPIATRTILVLTNGLIAKATRFPASYTIIYCGSLVHSPDSTKLGQLRTSSFNHVPFGSQP